MKFILIIITIITTIIITTTTTTIIIATTTTAIITTPISLTTRELPMAQRFQSILASHLCIHSLQVILETSQTDGSARHDSYVVHFSGTFV